MVWRACGGGNQRTDIRGPATCPSQSERERNFKFAPGYFESLQAATDGNLLLVPG
jgi:hypothetical protein